MNDRLQGYTVAENLYGKEHEPGQDHRACGGWRSSTTDIDRPTTAESNVFPAFIGQR